MIALTRTFPGDPHCCYCGLRLNKGQVCVAHADLPNVDDDFRNREMREWWQARFTAAELDVLAQGLTAA